jgi:N6-adenosine-specific RNA methylase IME4
MKDALAKVSRGDRLPANVIADRVISRLREAEKALQQATTIHQAKVIGDMAAAQEVFAHRQKLGDEVIGYAHSIKIEALARLGDLLSAMPKAKGAKGIGKSKSAVPDEYRTQVDTYADLGIDKKTAAIAQQLAALPSVTRQEIAARETSLSDALRTSNAEKRRKERIETIVTASAGNTPLETANRYPVIYADPPWRYEHVKTESRAIENQYPTMALDEICALPLADVTTDDALLFLWATSPKLAEAMRVVESWGFTYRTSMVWVKDQIGMGYYARQRHELLLIGTKGEPPVPEPANRPDSVIESPRGRHSEKPEVFYELIERMYPELPKVELFARQPREGWGRWGNQAEATL